MIYTSEAAEFKRAAASKQLETIEHQHSKLTQEYSKLKTKLCSLSTKLSESESKLSDTVPNNVHFEKVNDFEAQITQLQTQIFLLNSKNDECINRNKFFI